MHPAAKLQFERVVIEFARWRALTEDDRPPAPAWWWGPAVEVRDVVGDGAQAAGRAADDLFRDIVAASSVLDAAATAPS